MDTADKYNFKVIVFHDMYMRHKSERLALIFKLSHCQLSMLFDYVDSF